MKTLAEEFDLYIIAVFDEPISDDRRKEIRRAFYAGARIATSHIGNEILDRRLLALTILNLDTELNRFAIAVAENRA